MKSAPLFKLLFSLLVVIASLHILSSFLYLYWSIQWIHLIIHFLSGILVSLSALCLIYVSEYDFLRKRISEAPIATFFVAIGASLVAGILWEVFELTFGITFLSDQNYLSQNGSEVIAALSGGLIGWAYFSYKHLNHRV